MEALFGAELSLPVKFFIAFAVVLGLIGAAAYLVRRFGGRALGTAVQRGRQPRLAVVDAAPIDNRRRLVIVRRDNVEHLLLVGGPTDVLIEANIVRAAATQSAREFPPVRAAASADTAPPLAAAEFPPRPVPPEPPARPKRPDAEPPSPWPLQHVAEPPVRPAPVTAEVSPPTAPPVMPIVAPPVAPQVAPPMHVETTVRAVMVEAEQVSSPLRVSEAAPMWSPLPLEPVAAPTPPTPPTPPAPPATVAASDDQNLADMAFRLEAALRRPLASDETIVLPSRPVAVPDPQMRMQPAPEVAPPTITRVKPTPEPVRTPVAEPRPEPRHERPVYEGLEREMASLLGRPLGSS